MNIKFKSLMAAAMVAIFATAAFAQDAGNLLLPPATYTAGQTAQQPVGGMPIASPTAAPNTEELNKKAFDAALEALYPLTPEQQKTVREKGDQIDRAVGEPLIAVSPVSRSVRVSLRSGDAPPTIKTSPGWISTITFADVTGQPWPVLNVTNGNPDAYDVKNSGAEGTSNIVTISSKQAYVPSNIAVTLLGAKVPVMITLSPSTGAVDFRVDAQIDQRGPNASYDVISSDSLPATSDSLMLGFLDGVPPGEATKLRTSDSNTQAWRYNDLLYIRTTRSLLSPAYLSKQSNVVGVNVYVLNESPVMVMSGSGNGPDAGRLESVTINR
jgi:intracellular multiplication protein IcmK